MEAGSLPYVKGLLGGLFVAPLSGVTDIVVPIGEVTYFSEVTMHEEVLCPCLKVLSYFSLLISAIRYSRLSRTYVLVLVSYHFLCKDYIEQLISVT